MKNSLTLPDGGTDSDTMELSVSEAWGDANGDCMLGLEEAVKALRVTSGLQ